MSIMDSSSTYDSQAQSQWFPPGSGDGNTASSSSLGLNISSLSVSPTHGYHAHQQHHHNHNHHPHHQQRVQQQPQQYPNRPFPLRITTSTSASSMNSSGSGSSSAPPSRKRSFTSNPPSASAGPSSAVLPSTPGPNTGDSDPNDPPDGTPTYNNADGDIDMDNDFSSMPPSSAVSTTTSATFLGTPSGGASPVDGNNSGSGGDEDGASGLFAGTASGGNGSIREAPGILGGVGGIMGMLGKPMPTNNFVTKLYQMINDPKSAHFITWTELGTSFVVSNVGEFSRSILGSHFKHNNFSSFVRQLNMYGFHKINRTPRAQRTSTDAQTWEFSHHKFLRGRPDLLDEIKRKALEPDPGVKQRVELPGEVAAQLNSMREDNRRVWDQLAVERRKVDRLVGVVNRLWDLVGKGFHGSIPPFPIADLLDTSPLPVPSSTSTVSSSTSSGNPTGNPNPASVNGTTSNTNASESDNPNIYITSPTSSSARFGPGPGGLPPGGHPSFGMSMSPGSSPTAMEFPPHIHGHGHISNHQQFHHPNHHQHPHHPHQQQQHHQPHHLSRQHGYPFGSRSGSPHPNNDQSDGGGGGGGGGTNVNDMFEDGSLSSSSSVMSPTGGNGNVNGDGEEITGRGSTKRQRMSTSVDDLPSYHSPHHAHMGVVGVGVGVGVGVVGSPYQQQSPLQSPQQIPNSQPFLSPPDKKFSTRARSDSAPLGYGSMGMGGGGGVLSPWGGAGGNGVHGRPRSGSGLLHVGQNRGMMVGLSSRGAGGGMGGNNGGQGIGMGVSAVPNNAAPGGQTNR